MGERRWTRLLPVYPLWLLAGALGLWLLATLRHALLTALALYYVRGSAARGWRAGFCDKAGIVAAGLAWLVFVMATESYLREGAEKGLLLRRSALVLGLEVLVIAVAHLSLCLMPVPRPAWLPWIAAGLELVIGLALVILSRPAGLFRQRPRLPRDAAGTRPHSP
ncbi:MAG: hypothetical protein K6V36_00930 [Anaerolineae bacterium]|nr:hypothetical protein [Anaerolineae bacterium]